jgi:hypothetical protein
MAAGKMEAPLSPDRIGVPDLEGVGRTSSSGNRTHCPDPFRVSINRPCGHRARRTMAQSPRQESKPIEHHSH